MLFEVEKHESDEEEGDEEDKEDWETLKVNNGRMARRLLKDTCGEEAFVT